ncbi:MAG: hypothetical protein ABJA70_04925 [Chryseolinea sp.]
MKHRSFKTFSSATFLILLLLIVISCVNDTLPAADEYSCSSNDEVSFANDINPIINTKCAIEGDGGCHNGGNGPTLDWRVFNNFQGHASSVKDRITRPATASGHMPKIGSLTDDQIRLLICWVNQGAQNN